MVKRVRRGRPPAIPVTADLGARIVKKYGNRRLYDTRSSRYINLEELMDLFAGKEEVRVLDAITGEDLTERTLAHAILSGPTGEAGSMVPTDLLRALVRYRRGPRRSDFARHLTEAVNAFSKKR